LTSGKYPLKLNEIFEIAETLGCPASHLLQDITDQRAAWVFPQEMYGSAGPRHPVWECGELAPRVAHGPLFVFVDKRNLLLYSIRVRGLKLWNSAKTSSNAAWQLG
jgi:hypothetical protein